MKDPRIEGGSRAHHPRKATYYKLSEKDHAVIKDGLSKFAPVYMIALKLGCGYRTLCDYIKKNPDLAETQKDANDNVVSFAFGKLMQKVSKGNVPSILFTLERLDPKRFGNRQVIENVGELPSVTIGVFDEADEVEPIDPATTGADAAKILENAVKRAEAASKPEADQSVG